MLSCFDDSLSLSACGCISIYVTVGECVRVSGPTNKYERNETAQKFPHNHTLCTPSHSHAHISYIVLPVGFQVDCKIRKRTPHAHTHITAPLKSLCLCMYVCACQLSLHKWLPHMSLPKYVCVRVLKNEPIMAEKLQPEIRLASVGSLFPAWVSCMCVFNECPCSHTLLIEEDSTPINTNGTILIAIPCTCKGYIIFKAKKCGVPMFRNDLLVEILLLFYII